VWAAAQPTPLLVGKRLFRNQVTDLAWSPDGYTALAASSDGTVASFQFSPAELGRAHSREELEAIFQQLYGSAQGAHGKRLFAESADQLALEATAPVPLASAAAAQAAQDGAAAPPAPS
jgi:protein HIRA/HIR1